jgi:hypothetical protein
MRRWRVGSAFSLALLVLGLAGEAGGVDASFTVEVPGGKVQSVRLRNLPEGAVVAVDVRTNREIVVIFLRAKDPGDSSARVPPLFAGRLERHLAFSVTIPSTGHYYIVFDNRKGEDPRKVSLRVQATRGPARDASERKGRTF